MSHLPAHPPQAAKRRRNTAGGGAKRNPRSPQKASQAPKGRQNTPRPHAAARRRRRAPHAPVFPFRWLIHWLTSTHKNVTSSSNADSALIIGGFPYLIML